MAKRKNGRQLIFGRDRAATGRRRVLAAAKRDGFISNDRARKVGGWNQPWYHLNKLAEAGYLKHDGFSEWRPTRRTLALALRSQ